MKILHQEDHIRYVQKYHLVQGYICIKQVRRKTFGVKWWRNVSWIHSKIFTKRGDTKEKCITWLDWDHRRQTNKLPKKF